MNYQVKEDEVAGHVTRMGEEECRKERDLEEIGWVEWCYGLD
jgi:hypothetical protein